jgi:hypothetical protein
MKEMHDHLLLFNSILMQFQCCISIIDLYTIILNAFQTFII